MEFKELFLYNTVLLTPPGHELLRSAAIKLDDIASWPLILPALGSRLRQNLEQALKARGLTPNVVLTLDDTESMKRYVEIGMGLALGSDYTLHATDRRRFGVLPLDHLFLSSAIGVVTLKGKFAGQAVQNFVEIMSEQILGAHNHAPLDVENRAGIGLAEVGSKDS
jgi:LysR family cys regulon transcriptional activator